MVGVIWMVAAAAVVTAHASKDRPGWNVGWAFVSHGGFPALPAGWPQRSYRLNSSLVGYFLGNASGMNSAEEVRAEDRLGVVGIGWQINNIPSHHTHLEQFEEETARQLKAIRPDVKAMALRNTEVATVFWDAAKIPDGGSHHTGLLDPVRWQTLRRSMGIACREHPQVLFQFQ